MQSYTRAPYLLTRDTLGFLAFAVALVAFAAFLMAPAQAAIPTPADQDAQQIEQIEQTPTVSAAKDATAVNFPADEATATDNSTIRALGAGLGTNKILGNIATIGDSLVTANSAAHAENPANLLANYPNPFNSPTAMTDSDIDGNVTAANNLEAGPVLKCPQATISRRDDATEPVKARLDIGEHLGAPAQLLV